MLIIIWWTKCGWVGERERERLDPGSLEDLLANSNHTLSLPAWLYVLAEEDIKSLLLDKCIGHVVENVFRTKLIFYS